MALAKTIKTFNNNFVIISSDSSGWYRSCFTHVMCLHVELKDTWLATADAKGDKTWMGTNTLSWHGMMLWNIYIYTYRYVSKYTSVDLCFLYIIHLREKKSLLPIMPIYIYIYYLSCHSMFPRHDFLLKPKKPWQKSFATSPRVL